MKAPLRYALAVLCFLSGVFLMALVEHHKDKPVALCPNYHIIQHHPTPWEAERGRQVRFDSLPPCP